MGEDGIPWGQYDKAYEAIHSALQTIMTLKPGEKITKLKFTWNPNGTLKELKPHDGDTLLFTLSFTWNADGTLKEMSRS